MSELPPYDVAAEKKRHAQTLLDAVERGSAIPLDTKLAFGLSSTIHESVLIAAIRDGRLTAADVTTCCLNGKALTERIGRSSPPVALTFRTLDDFYRKHQ